MNLQPPSNTDNINDLLVQSCTDLLKQFDLNGEVVDELPSDSQICSLISANGDGIRMVSFFQPDSDLILRVHPSTETEITQDELEDWCCEFSNQLIGRLKTKLLTRGCNVSIGLPSLLVGEKISASKSQEAVTTKFCISTQFGNLTLTSFIRLDPEFELADENDVSQSGAGVMLEGEVSLF